MIGYCQYLATWFRGLADTVDPPAPAPMRALECGDRLTVLVRHPDGSATVTTGRVNVIQGRAGSEKIEFIALHEVAS